MPIHRALITAKERQMSRSILVVAALGTAALIAAVPVASADPSTGDAYVGGGWGRFDLDLDNFNDVDTAVNSITHASNYDSWKIFAGYRFSPYLALEGDYLNFEHAADGFVGSGSNGNYALHVGGFAPFVVGTLPAGPVEFFGKAGWLFYNSDLHVNFNAPGQEFLESTHSRSDFIWGGGAGLTFFQHLNVSAEYDGIRIVNARNSNALWLEAAWRF
jgi:Outer membrane protein beta-barrel domain